MIESQLVYNQCCHIFIQVLFADALELIFSMDYDEWKRLDRYVGELGAKWFVFNSFFCVLTWKISECEYGL